ncbi:hypothetical protein SAMN05216216_104169 [Lacicoccus qingdaonensis]|uniref:Uncharacterized protein n=1 Tax=Lacicoccus qingdaonensis TaxID=576118 RepID=A0A1G9CSS0_9BACL|nr:hypothetical protein SAMN05216216_104169 [Salinicoccus qingdaonensis]
MKKLLLENDGFISFSLYIVLIYLISVYFHFYNRYMMVIEIRTNLILIYENYINKIIGAG